MNALPTGYYDAITRKKRGWRRFFGTSLKRTPFIVSNFLAKIVVSESSDDTALKPSKAVDVQNGFTGLRIRLVGAVFLAVVPALAIIYFFKLGEW